MNSNAVHYDAAGANNPGLAHRALMVARELKQAGKWDGQQLIVIVNPDALARELDLYGRQASTLQAGTDYRL